MADILAVLWDLANSPAVIAALAGLLVWALNRLYARKPLWRKWEGVLISAVKHAEKAVPDHSPDKGAARLNAALKYAVSLIEAYERRALGADEVNGLKDALCVAHADLEAKDQL